MKLTIRRGLGLIQVVDAKSFGRFAVHKSVNYGEGEWTITHIESGMHMGNLIGWAVDDPRVACRVAKAFECRAPSLPRELWGETQWPASEARDWACAFESIAAEVLSRAESADV